MASYYSYGGSYGITYGGSGWAQILAAAQIDKPSSGRYWLIADTRDNFLHSGNDIQRDPTIASVCKFRLLCRKGQWVYGPEIGSRLHTIKTLRQGEQKAEAMVKEALKDLIDQGLILTVEVGDVVAERRTGRLAIGVMITVPERGEELDLGLIPIGS